MPNGIRIAAPAIAATLFVGWWQVDGPGADLVADKRPLPHMIRKGQFDQSEQSGFAQFAALAG